MHNRRQDIQFTLGAQDTALTRLSALVIRY